MKKNFSSYSSVPRRTIDITPGAGWRGTMHLLATAVRLAIALPLLWLLGGLVLLGLIAAASVVFAWLVARLWWIGRRAAAHPVDIANSR